MPTPFGLAAFAVLIVGLIVLAIGEGHDDAGWNHLRGWFAILAVAAIALIVVIGPPVRTP